MMADLRSAITVLGGQVIGFLCLKGMYGGIKAGTCTGYLTCTWRSGFQRFCWIMPASEHASTSWFCMAAEELGVRPGWALNLSDPLLEVAVPVLRRHIVRWSDTILLIKEVVLGLGYLALWRIIPGGRLDITEAYMVSGTSIELLFIVLDLWLSIEILER